MPVGFNNNDLPPTDNDGVPDAPWALEFSRFAVRNSNGVLIGGAHAFAPNGGKALGEGVTVAHTDTGYTLHPELTESGAVPGARTFIDPVPSMLSITDISGVAENLSATFGASVTINNGIQVSAGASVSLTYPDDGIDPLTGPFNCHGTSTASLIMSPQGMPGGSYQADATNFMASSDAPDYIRGRAPVAITGAAPKAQLLPIRVSDSVLIDPIVSNNLTWGILHAAEKAMADPAVGVISISMGWPFAGKPLDFQLMERAIAVAADVGIVVCAAAAQTSATFTDVLEKATGQDIDTDVGVNQLTELYAGMMDSINDEAEALGDTAADYSDVATATAIMARLTGLALAENLPTLADLADEVQQQAEAAGRKLDQIEGYMRSLEGLTQSHADTARMIGGPAYPGTDFNTICCAACDFNGFEMPDGLYGDAVDITAPGVNMYSAKASRGSSGNDYYCHYSKGTSYSTAITAGACALWQAHHGRANLINTYGAPFMVHLFRWALKHSADQTTPQMTQAGQAWDSARRGFGILNAEQLLALNLPASTQALITALRNENIISDIQQSSLRAKAAAIGK
jgi:hypothetical protein